MSMNFFYLIRQKCIFAEINIFFNRGIDTSLLKNFIINNKLKGIERVVPVGQSLDISLMWDGYDIVNTLSRCIEIK